MYTFQKTPFSPLFSTIPGKPASGIWNGKFHPSAERWPVISCQKKAVKTALKLSSKTVQKYLGPPRSGMDRLRKRIRSVLVTGLAWTQVGGELLYVETVDHAGQRRADHHRKTWRCDEGICQGGRQLCPVPVRTPRHRSGLLQKF